MGRTIVRIFSIVTIVGIVSSAIIIAAIVAVTMPINCLSASPTPSDTPLATVSTPTSTPSAGSISCKDGWHLPLDTGYYISSGFGMRMHPIYHVWMMHNGTDLTGLPYGSPIYAVHEGDISWVGPYGGLGNYVEINHGAGIITGYGHMSSFAPGIQYAFITGHTVHVTAGQVIGYLGSTGDSTGVHLHYSVRLNGKFVDPVIFMQQIGLPLIAH